MVMGFTRTRPVSEAVIASIEKANTAGYVADVKPQIRTDHITGLQPTEKVKPQKASTKKYCPTCGHVIH